MNYYFICSNPRTNTETITLYSVPAITWMHCLLQAAALPDEWITLFDGESSGWMDRLRKPDSWKIEDGAIVTAGERSHLFYTGEVLDHNFKNFEFSVDVKTTAWCQFGGIYTYRDSRKRAGRRKAMNARC